MYCDNCNKEIIGSLSFTCGYSLCDKCSDKIMCECWDIYESELKTDLLKFYLEVFKNEDQSEWKKIIKGKRKKKPTINTD